MRNCAGCRQHINIGELLECCKCKGKFHYMCVNITKAHFVSHKQDLERTWICPECVIITRRILKNDLTPVRVHFPSSLLNDTVGSTGESPCAEAVKEVGSDIATNSTSLETVLHELREFRSLVTAHFEKQDARLATFTSDINDLRTCLKDVSQSCSSLKSDFDELAATVQNLTEENYSIRSATEHYDRRLRELETAKCNMEQCLAASKLRMDSVGSGTYANVAKKESTTLTRPQATSATPIVVKHTPKGERQLHRIPRSHRSVIKATGEADAELKSIEPVKYFHIWNLHADTTADNILAYMQKKGKGSAFTLQSPPPSHDSHKCFIVGVPIEHFEYFMSPSNWPKNVSLQEWFMYRKQRNQTNAPSSRTFFRQKTNESTS